MSVAPKRISLIDKYLGRRRPPRHVSATLLAVVALCFSAVIASYAFTATSTTNALTGADFYGVNVGAQQQAREWSAGRPADAAVMKSLAAVPVATWLNGDGDVTSQISAVLDKAGNSRAVFVLYNIPKRDCGQYSAGGTSADEYRRWVREVARAVRGHNPVVIVEPDALSTVDCLSPLELREREGLIETAVGDLAAASAAVYIDANSDTPLGDMVGRLRQSGIDRANGFSLNVSNFHSTDSENEAGRQLSSLVGGKHWVIDTSRNGAGSNGQWCNPSGRALGRKPTTATGVPGVDAYLWIKVPGESDGTCNGGPPAGEFWPDYALDLTRRS